MLTAQELRSSTQKELLEELKNARKEAMRVKIGVKTKHLKDSSLVVRQRSYIAQIKTIIKEMIMEEMVKEAKKSI
jgi:ribosomal protein L29